ncbi:MAG: ATP-binding protein [Alphaproteobacteria bacterium 64-6]|nr:MAG: ATP-binding protein [Alphaproteobacteria bacterium 64-6]
MKTLLSWSTGKDSAWALHVLRQTPGLEIVGLLSSINEEADRVSMHGVRRSLAKAQAKAAGLPLHIISLPSPCSNEVYEERMSAFVAKARAAGVEAMAFGDLFLEDIRAYREERLRGSGITPLFPLWERDTRQLARDMISSGLRARVVSLDPRAIARDLIGREFDADLLDDLPSTADPCGENGEFHTFAYAGPMFNAPIDVATGAIVERDGFVFADLVRQKSA